MALKGFATLIKEIKAALVNVSPALLKKMANVFGAMVSLIIHYENTPMQYTAIFHRCKNDKFQIKNCDIFLIFAQNIDRGYTLELPQ